MEVTINNESTKLNHGLRTYSNLSHWEGGGGGVNAFCWYQIFDLDSAVVEAQNVKLAWFGMFVDWDHSVIFVILTPLMTL